MLNTLPHNCLSLLTTPDEPWPTNVEPTIRIHVDIAFDPSGETDRKCLRTAFPSPETLVELPHQATFPTTLADELSTAKLVAVRRIQVAVTEVPSEDMPTRGSPELSVVEESTVVAPQSAALPLILAERVRTNMGAAARPVESTAARAHTAVALVPSADTATVGFFE